MSVGVALGTHYADQVRSPVVSHRVKTATFVVERGLPAPLPDKRFLRTAKQGVLIDMKTPIYMFGAPIEEEPYSWNVENAHHLMAVAAEDARKGGVWTPSRREADFVATLIRQQAEERAMADVRSKEVLMLNEGLSPDEVANLTRDEKDRLIRKYRNPNIRNAVQAAVDAEAGSPENVNLDSMTKDELLMWIHRKGENEPVPNLSRQLKPFLLQYAKHLRSPDDEMHPMLHATIPPTAPRMRRQSGRLAVGVSPEGARARIGLAAGAGNP